MRAKSDHTDLRSVNLSERESNKFNYAYSWLKEFSYTEGKPVPSTTDQRPIMQLPAGSVESYHELYELDAPKPWSASLSYFRAIWLKEFPNLRIRKLDTKNAIGGCNVCDTVIGNIKRAATSVDASQWKAVLDEHRSHYRGSRLTFNELVMESTSGSRAPGPLGRDQNVVIVSDAMDQAKLRLPHLSRQASKDLRTSFRPQMRCFASIVPGYLEHYCLVDPLVNKGGDICCEVLFRVLKTLASSMDLRKVRRVYICLDNSPSENKNSIVFSLCQSLVAQGIIKCIEIHFLVVGHTHNIADQRFSILSRALWKRDLRIMNPDDQMNFITSVLKPVADGMKSRFEIEYVTFCHHYRKTMESRGAYRQFFGIKGPAAAHLWKFEPCKTSGTVRIRTAQWMGHWSQAKGHTRHDSDEFYKDIDVKEPVSLGNYWAPPWPAPSQMCPQKPDLDKYCKADQSGCPIEVYREGFHKVKMLFTVSERESLLSYYKSMEARLKPGAVEPCKWKWLDESVASLDSECDSFVRLDHHQLRQKIVDEAGEKFANYCYPKVLHHGLKRSEAEPTIPIAPPWPTNDRQIHRKSFFAKATLGSTFDHGSFAIVKSSIGVPLQLVRINRRTSASIWSVTSYTPIASGEAQFSRSPLLRHHRDFGEQRDVSVSDFVVWGFYCDGPPNKLSIPRFALQHLAQELKNENQTDGQKIEMILAEVFMARDAAGDN